MFLNHKKEHTDITTAKILLESDVKNQGSILDVVYITTVNKHAIIMDAIVAHPHKCLAKHSIGYNLI